MTITQRRFGASGRLVTPVGYGAMVLEGYYGGIDDAAGVATLRAALDQGVTLIDTSDAYGDGHNERLVGQALRGRTREGLTVATKFGIVFDGTPATELPTGWGYSLQINGRPEYARRCLERSLQALGLDTIDLWYVHFPDPAVPIEETVGAMAEAVQAGKVRHLGLSNVSAEQVRRAHAVYPIAAVQNEYSLWRREAEAELLPTLARDRRRSGDQLGPACAGLGAGPGRADRAHPRHAQARAHRREPGGGQRPASGRGAGAASRTSPCPKTSRAGATPASAPRPRCRATAPTCSPQRARSRPWPIWSAPRRSSTPASAWSHYFVAPAGSLASRPRPSRAACEAG